MNPLLSIAIPTKDRYATLFPVLRVLIKYIEGSNYEIVVHDNSASNNAALEELKIINDDRIKYFYNPSPLNVTENTDLAIGHSTGEFMVVIGDDDLVSPYIMQIVNEVKASGLDALIFDKGNYYWKGITMYKTFAFHYPASLQYPKNASTAIQILSVDKELERVIKSGGVSFYNLPAAYHGLVKMEVMNKLKDKFGTYVPGSCPDMAMAVALSTVVEKYGSMNYPVTITGASKKSAAGMGVNKEHIAKIEDVTWLPKDIMKVWDIHIPRIWTGTTIYAQNVHEVFLKAGIEKLVNYKATYSYMFIREANTKKMVLPYLLSVHKSKIKKFTFLFSTFTKWLLFSMLYKSPEFVINLWYYIKGDFKRKVQLKNVDNVDECMQILKRNLIVK